MVIIVSTATAVIKKGPERKYCILDNVVLFPAVNGEQCASPRQKSKLKASV